ncbi:MAG TPA: RidA family protein [Bacteroidetes bacterium]|nr:RidA family protein [Bacteroidota bacterium]
METERISTGAPWEDKVGYSRAIRKGNMVWVSGTAPVVEGKTVACGDAYGQTIACLEIIKMALEAAGARLEDVVRTRMFVTDISQWEAIGRAHGAYFRDIRPATTMVEVRALIDPDMLVEIEAEAVI